MTDLPKVHPLQRAWAAGVFDSRCTVPTSGATIRFESVDEAMMTRFHKTVKVGQLDKDMTKRTRLPVWIFRTLNMDDSRTLILLMSPFLSPMKMKHTSDMLARIERNPTWLKKNPHTKKVTLSETAPAPNVVEEQEPPNTATDGVSASPAE